VITSLAGTDGVPIYRRRHSHDESIFRYRNDDLLHHTFRDCGRDRFLARPRLRIVDDDVGLPRRVSLEFDQEMHHLARAPAWWTEVRAWMISLASGKAKGLGILRELRTTRLLTRHVRDHAVAAGHPCPANVVQGTVCKLLTGDEVKPHTMRYSLGRRDEAFETRMAEVLCVYREVAVMRPAGNVHACVKDRHRGFVSILKKIDATYAAIKLLLDDHSAHISKETKAQLATQPKGRFAFVLTPKHASWPNLVEGSFPKMACSKLRHLRVASKSGLKARIFAYLDDISAEPAVHTWTSASVPRLKHQQSGRRSRQ
jgi:hypothetical protein